MDYFDLCSVIVAGEKTELSDNRATKLLARLWNDKHPEYRVRIVWNSHDFGNYPSLGMSAPIFELAQENGLDVETEILDIADEWNENFDNITAELWEKYSDINPTSFKLEY